MLIVTVIVTVLDYVVPGWLTRVTGGTKYASRGATAGMLVGILFFPPWGMIVGCSRLLPRFPARYRGKAGRFRGHAVLHHHRPDTVVTNEKRTVF